MSAREPPLACARARRRQMALDPRDLASRAAAEVGTEVSSRHRATAATRVLRRILVTTMLFAALAVGALLAWSSGFASTVHGEISVVGAQFSAWAAAQLDGTAVEDAAGTRVVGPAIGTVRTGTIANTGGSGVSMRRQCARDARVGGVIDDRAVVTILKRGAGDCAGWSFVAVGSVSSWVNDRYLESNSAH